MSGSQGSRGMQINKKSTFLQYFIHILLNWKNHGAFDYCWGQWSQKGWQLYFCSRLVS